MTDLEKTIELYKGFGIDLKTKQTEVGFEVGLGEYEYGVKYSDKFCGYGGFYSVIFFDLNEKFIKQGFWE